MRRRPLLRSVGAGAGTALLASLAGCTDGDGEASPTDTPADTDTETDTPMDTEPTAADVAVASVDPFGDILVDAEGLTLYLFTQDSGGESVCYDQCAENWPPLTVEGTPEAGEGVTAELGTTERDDGSMQVTAAGNPLYYFAGDNEPGDVNGQGLNDAWYVLTPDGEMVESGGGSASNGTPTATETETDMSMSGSGGGGGGGY